MSAFRVRAKSDTYQDSLGIANPPSKVQDIAICLDNFRSQLNAEPANTS